jgi:hypothetical protein
VQCQWVVRLAFDLELERPEPEQERLPPEPGIVGALHMRFTSGGRHSFMPALIPDTNNLLFPTHRTSLLPVVSTEKASTKRASGFERKGSAERASAEKAMQLLLSSTFLYLLDDRHPPLIEY